jgi:structural maintenance of chromosome 3 (chondroitin sulfate proteoglycan 6)
MLRKQHDLQINLLEQ